MNARLAGVLLAGLVSASAAAKDPGPFKPPEGAVLLCSGHVTGAPQPDGSPGPHISWTAYSSRKDVPTVAAAYRKSLGTELRKVERACKIWRDPLDKPKRILEVCPVGEKGPWSECKSAPAKAKSIILISDMARLD